MTESSFAEELRSLAVEEQKNMPSTTATEDELVALEKKAKEEATRQAKKGYNEAYIFFDKFERLDEKNKNTKLACKEIPAFERAMKRLGLNVIFCNDMCCGMCNMADCSTPGDYGYKITW